MARVSSKVAQVDEVLSLIYVTVGSQSRRLLLDLAAGLCQRHKAQILCSISVNSCLSHVLLPAFFILLFIHLSLFHPLEYLSSFPN
jgi:hypothetical protein